MQFGGGDNTSGGSKPSRSKPSTNNHNNDHNKSDINHHNHDHNHTEATSHTHRHLTAWGEVQYWHFDFNGMPFVLGVATKRSTTVKQ